MASFQYPYQRILEVKSKEKEMAQIQMAKALQRQTRAEIKINELESKIDQVNTQIEQRYQETVKVQDLLGMEYYTNTLRKRLHLEKNEFAFAKKNVAKKQEVLLEKLKEEKTWERLKEKKEEEYLHEVKLAEQQELDEMASSSFTRLSDVRGEKIGRE